jgi:hypothetical protein
VIALDKQVLAGRVVYALLRKLFGGKGAKARKKAKERKKAKLPEYLVIYPR